MDDKECMRDCLKDAKMIMDDVFGAYDFDPRAYDAVARIATTLFHGRSERSRGFHCVTNGITGAGKGEGNSGCTGTDRQETYYVVSRAYNIARIATFNSSHAERRSLCRKLLTLLQWLTSENTVGSDKELLQRYRQQAFDTIDAIEATLR